jgi:O-antigen/teichoic acid export membrane protein
LEANPPDIPEKNALNVPDPPPTLRESGKHMTRAYFFNFLSVYGVIPINLLLTILVARFLSPDNWGIYIYVIMLLSGSQIVMVFIPPSISAVILYQIPEFIVKKEFSRVKGYISYFIKIKSIVAFIFMLGFMITALFLLQYPKTSLHAKLILIIAPIIITQEIVGIFLYLSSAMKQFDINTKLRIQEKIIYFFGYLILFLVDWNETMKLIGMGIIVNITLFAFLPKLLIQYKRDFGQYTSDKISRNDLKSSVLFGTSFSITNSASIAYEQVYYGLINLFGLPRFNTYSNICQNLSNEIIQGFSPPLGPVLSDLEKTQQRDKMILLFKKGFNLSNILIGFLIGVLFFAAEIYILLIYPPEYLDAVKYVQTYVLIVYFINVINNYRNLYSITNYVKKMWQIDLIIVIYSSIFAIFGMILFGFMGLILSRVLGFAIGSLLFWYFGAYKLNEFKLPLWLIFKHLFALFVIIIIILCSRNYIEKIILTESVFFNILNFLNQILPGFDGLIYLNQIKVILNGIICIILFGLIYISYIIIFRAISKQDIDQFDRLNFRIPFKKQISAVLKRILRNEKL